MIVVHKTDGTYEQHLNQNILTLEWMQKQVGGYIEIVTARDGKSQIIVNEEGKIHGLPFNKVGTDWWELHFGLGTDEIWGDCIIVTKPHAVK